MIWPGAQAGPFFVEDGPGFTFSGGLMYQKLLMISELVRQQTILYHTDIRSIYDRIVSLCQANIRPIVRGKARCNAEFGAKSSISFTG